MAEQYAISAANLSRIENNLKTIFSEIEDVNSRVNSVDENVRIVYSEVGALAKEFHDFVQMQARANNKSNSQQRLIQIHQDIEKRFGHYDVVRRTTTGILQADDLGIVRTSTINDATEEMMITTPGYWLAPCLVALAAWISNNPELADRAVKEGIKRDDEKTSLFFALICRRAGRKNASLKWTQRYLANQDEEKLDRKTIIILDAFASGLLGADTEGVITKQMDLWLNRLSEKAGFIEQQTSQWSDAINLKRKPLSQSEYPYLRKYSKTWPVLEDIMEGARLHADILAYFTKIFEQECSTGTLKEQLDEILDSLVTEYDDEELPLRREEKYHQLVVNFNGDENRAKKHMKLEESAFEEHKDFTQLLTDAAMKPESSHASVSTQKFAIALSKNWIQNAYNDITAKNRMKIPVEIQINVDTFNSCTTDGSNEKELLDSFYAQIESEKAKAVEECKMTMFEQYSLYGGIALAVLGLVFLFITPFLGIVGIIAAIGLVLYHFSRKKNLDKARASIIEQYNKKSESGAAIIRATLAEVVDFQREFVEKDSQSELVTNYMANITPDQYVRKLADTGRRIKVVQ